MKKLLFLVTLLLIGSFFFLREQETIIKVTPFVNEIPTTPPYVGHPIASALKEKGCQFEWMLLHTLPKKREFLKRLSFLFQRPKIKKIIINNLNLPFSKAKLAQVPKDKMILILWEPPSVLLHQYNPDVLNLFDTVLTWNDDLVDGQKFIKFNYPVLIPMHENLPSFDERKFLCMIASNLQFNSFEKELYSMRRSAVAYFESKPEGTFDLYGRGWEEFKNGKGRVGDKLETLKEYKFNFCFENCNIPGYITEKIFDSFAVGTIPIYLGATNIQDYIPSNCFIDYRQFNNFDEMLTFIQNISKEEYEQYLMNIKTYLASPKSNLFSQETFSETILQAIN